MSRVALILGFLITTAASAQHRKPNILVIVADDLGYGDLGVHGCSDIPTPHIDALANAGVRCTSGYVSGPYCSPTRAGLLTGRYQQRFGHEFNPGPPNRQSEALGLSLKETTLPKRLKDAGYQTGMVGKWHLGHAPQFVPPARGFGEFYGFLGGAHPYEKLGQGPNVLRRGTEPLSEEKEYLTDAFGREAVAFIDRHKDKPFFLYLTFNAVHTPLEATSKYLQRFGSIKDEKRRKYAAMLSAMDDAVGRVLGKLKEARLDNDTLVFFISDNGGPEQANGSNNGPLRGVKATTWEGGIRVPFFIRWPGKIKTGAIYGQPVIQLDIVPTVLAASGVELDGDSKLDGVNLLPHIDGKTSDPPHDALYWRFGGQVAIRAGDWKLVKAAEGVGGGIRRAKASLEGAKLFNLKDDIGEQHDMAAKHPDKVKDLGSRWEKWNAELVPPAWGPPNRAANQSGDPRGGSAARSDGARESASAL